MNCHQNLAEKENLKKEENAESSEEDFAVEYPKAPDFSLSDREGRAVALSDFKGKLVYMDIWATWCGPCRQQFPALRAIEEKYKNKGIVFLSISVDPDHLKPQWEKMIDEEQLKGVQLFAGKTSGFDEAYGVEFIPRFLLISPQGDILMDQAPFPMDHQSGEINPHLEEIFQLYINTK